MFFITTLLGSADVIGNHVPDSIQAVMLLLHEIGSKCGRGDFRKMLMFRNSEHLLFGQAT